MIILGNILYFVGLVGAVFAGIKWFMTDNSLDGSTWSMVLSAFAIVLSIGNIII